MRGISCENLDGSTRGHVESKPGNGAPVKCRDCQAEKPPRGGWSHACPKGGARRSFKGG